MRVQFAVLVLGLTSFAALTEAGETDKVAKTFAQRCASCHTVPDPMIRTDLAWLDQVKRTT